MTTSCLQAERQGRRAGPVLFVLVLLVDASPLRPGSGNLWADLDDSAVYLNDLLLAQASEMKMDQALGDSGQLMGYASFRFGESSAARLSGTISGAPVVTQRRRVSNWPVPNERNQARATPSLAANRPGAVPPGLIRLNPPESDLWEHKSPGRLHGSNQLKEPGRRGQQFLPNEPISNPQRSLGDIQLMTA